MRKLAILTFMTLDGVMQAPSQPEEDRSGGFASGGWARPFWDEVMAQVEEEAMVAPYDLLLGRKTYDIFAPHFSTADGGDAAADTLNNATKYVVTNTVKSLTWKNSVPVSGDIVSEINRLKAGDGPLLQVHGSWQLIQTLLANALVDELRLWTFPVMVGPGKRLFGHETASSGLKLVKSRTTPGGVVMGIYRRDQATVD